MMAPHYSIRSESQTKMSRTHQSGQPIIRELELSQQQKGAQLMWIILKNAMRLQFFKSMQKIRDYNFNINRKKFVNENLNRGYRIDEGEKTKLRPRARTLDPFAEYSRARLLKDITQKLKTKNPMNITISQIDTLSLEERIYHMEKMLQESIIQKQQNSKANDTDSNNSIFFELMAEVIRLKKELAKRQAGSDASNRYPQSISNISKHSQAPFTNSIENTSSNFDKHIRKDLSFTPSEKQVIKNIDSKYERIPINPLHGREPEMERRQTHKITPQKYRFHYNYPPPSQKSVGKSENHEIRRQPPRYQPVYKPPVQTQIVHNRPVIVHPQQASQNPNIRTFQYQSPEPKIIYHSPPPIKFSETNPLSLLQQKMKNKDILEQLNKEAKIDKRGKKLNVVSELPSRRKQSTEDRKSERPPIMFSGRPIKTDDRFCDECGRRCGCKQTRNY